MGATKQNNQENDYVAYSPDFSGAASMATGGLADGIAAADRLQGIIERADSWPIWAADRVGGIDTGTYAQMGTYGQSLREIALWTAMRENDRDALIQITNWERDRPLHVDPLPERISEAYSDLLYGEEPKFFSEDTSDQKNMDELVEETALPAELKRWCDLGVSEGEVWWRCWTDLDSSEHPLVSGHSRMDVIPLFVGHKIVACAFVDNLLNQEIYIEQQMHVVFWRHIEIHTKGYVRNLLYQGSMGGLGKAEPLSSLPETAHLDEDWEHGLPVMLAGRIVNKMGRDFRLGVSQYQGVRDLLMDLNEARTIMAENARLVLKARMVVPANALDADGNFDASDDVVVAESLDEELAGSKSGPYAVLEYNFQSAALIEHKNELTLDILARVGLAEQFGQQSRGGGGQAFTGTALRTKLVPTVQSGQGKAREYDRKVPHVLKALALLDNLSPEKGGCGTSWTNAAGPHVQQRANLLPEDPNEKVQRHVMAVQGEVESIQTAVSDLHDEDWSEEEIELEVTRIRGDRMLGPTYADINKTTAEELSTEIEAEQGLSPMGTPTNTDAPPSKPNGGPGSAVSTPKDVLGSTQPGVSPDGQSPGKKPPQVKAGGPK